MKKQRTYIIAVSESGRMRFYTGLSNLLEGMSPTYSHAHKFVDKEDAVFVMEEDIKPQLLSEVNLHLLEDYS